MILPHAGFPRRKHALLRLFHGLAFLFGTAALLVAQDSMESAFARGNAAFAEDNFPAAIAAYEEALMGGSTVNLHYNLGTAYAHEEEWGRAALHLLKALALDPNLNDARTHLALVGERSGLGWEERNPIEQAATILPLNAWAWLAVLGFWGAVFLWVSRPREGGSALHRLGRIAFCALFLVALAALSSYHLSGNRGVVLDEAHLRVAPTEQSPLGAEVMPGMLGSVQKIVHGFYLVRTAAGDEGYLLPGEFETVWE